MYVVKRDGRKEAVKFDKITARIKKLCYGLNPLVAPEKVAMKVIEGLFDGVTTSELDNLAAEVAATNTITHPDYALLASRIAVSNLHKNTKKSFSDTVTDLYEYIDPKTNEKAPLISDEVYKIVKKNSDVLDSTIIYDRDFRYDFFGFKTLERSYLLKLKGQVAERPQQMIMRVAVGIHKDDLDAAIETINARVGFDELQAMRDASPTGGALGQVSELELKQLNAALGSLNRKQSKEQFLRNLERVETQYQNILDKIAETGDGTYLPKKAGSNSGSI